MAISHTKSISKILTDLCVIRQSVIRQIRKIKKTKDK